MSNNIERDRADEDLESSLDPNHRDNLTRNVRQRTAEPEHSFEIVPSVSEGVNNMPSAPAYQNRGMQLLGTNMVPTHEDEQSNNVNNHQMTQAFVEANPDNFDERYSPATSLYDPGDESDSTPYSPSEPAYMNQDGSPNVDLIWEWAHDPVEEALRRRTLDRMVRVFVDGHNPVGSRLIDDIIREMESDGALHAVTYEGLSYLREKLENFDGGLSEHGIVSNLTKTKICRASSGFDGDELCSICLGGYQCGENITKLTCNHVFHFECIKKWLMRKNRCPICNFIGVKLNYEVD